MLSPEQKTALTTRLDAQEAELRKTISASTDSSKTVALDQTLQGRLSRMDALQGQAMAKATLARATRKLKAVESSKAHIDDEDFGLCQGCDEAIAFARLEFDPTATLCITCAENQER